MKKTENTVDNTSQPGDLFHYTISRESQRLYLAQDCTLTDSEFVLISTSSLGFPASPSLKLEQKRGMHHTNMTDGACTLVVVGRRSTIM